MESREVHWFHYLQILFRWRKFYLITIFGVCVVAAIISLILPKYYQSTATILPPVTSGGFESLIPDEIRGFFGSFAGENVEVSTYMAILGSRNLREKMIGKFDLTHVYRFQEPYHIEDLLRVLDKNIAVTFDGQNPLRVSVVDRDPKRAAEMVNFMVTELDQMYQKIKNQQAHFNRAFLEGRVEETRAALTVYEDSLRIFQEQNQAISPTDQAVAAIKIASDLVAQLMALDVQIQVLENSVQSDHPQLKMLREQRKGIQNQIKLLTQSSDGKSIESIPMPGLDQLPKLGMRYLQLYREVEIRNKLLEFLIPQYEQARIQEVRDTPTVTVLDEGRVPTKRIKPKRKKLVLVTALLTFLVCSIIVFSFEYYSRIKDADPATYRGLSDMRKKLRQDFWPIKSKGDK
jgi:tyrosine-protein kinase Etk/Wzc